MGIGTSTLNELEAYAESINGMRADFRAFMNAHVNEVPRRLFKSVNKILSNVLDELGEVEEMVFELDVAGRQSPVFIQATSSLPSSQLRVFARPEPGADPLDDIFLKDRRLTGGLERELKEPDKMGPHIRRILNNSLQQIHAAIDMWNATLQSLNAPSFLQYTIPANTTPAQLLPRSSRSGGLPPPGPQSSR